MYRRAGGLLDRVYALFPGHSPAFFVNCNGLSAMIVRPDLYAKWDTLN